MANAGIVGYGAYVPFNRLQREIIGAALESRGGQGERAVASYDEDTATMAVEAARNALNEADSSAVRTLYFSTTRPPYEEKLNAATVHAALSLADGVRALDLGGSARAGLTTLLTARDAASNAGLSLATVSDIRVGAPEGQAEQAGGDGAAAFLFGTDGVIAEVEATYSETLEHLSLWRNPGELFAKTWEERFGLTQAYGPLLGSALKKIFEVAGFGSDRIRWAIIDTPNPRATAGGQQILELPEEYFVDDLSATVGHTGAAHAPLMLASTLDQAEPGDRILVVSVSDGVDAAVLKTTDAIKNYTPKSTVASLIDSKRNDLAYARYLKWRGIMPTERPRRPDPDRPAGPPVFRRRHWKFGLVGSECTQCGARHLPPQSVCVECHAAEQMREIPFADRKAKVKTYTLDRLAFTAQPPMVSAILDFDGGGRVEMEITDCEPEKVRIGDEVEMTFRRLFTADGIHNYFWKSRPLR